MLIKTNMLTVSQGCYVLVYKEKLKTSHHSSETAETILVQSQHHLMLLLLLLFIM